MFKNMVQKKSLLSVLVKSVTQRQQQVRCITSDGKIPSIHSVSTGRQGEELKDAAMGVTLFNRDPIRTTESDGNSKENPIMVPSFEHERAVGVAHNDSSYVFYFNLQKGPVHYLPNVNKYFKLYCPADK